MRGMKKVCSIIALFSLFITGCGNSAEIEQLKKENAQLKEQVGTESRDQTEVAQEDTSTSAPASTEVPTEAPTEAPTPVPTVKKLTKREKYEQYAKQVKVKVYNKKVLPKDYDIGRYSEFIELDCKVVNKSKKSIKGIKGMLYIYDQFEDLITTIDWDFSDGAIAAGKTKKFTDYGLEYNQFRDDHNQLYNTKFDDMIFKYEIEQVNFTDGYKLKL